MERPCCRSSTRAVCQGVLAGGAARGWALSGTGEVKIQLELPGSLQDPPSCSRIPHPGGMRQLQHSLTPALHQAQVLQKQGKTPSNQLRVPHVVFVKLLEKSPPACPRIRAAAPLRRRGARSSWKRWLPLNKGFEMSPFIRGAVTARWGTNAEGARSCLLQELRHPRVHPTQANPAPRPQTPNTAPAPRGPRAGEGKKPKFRAAGGSSSLGKPRGPVGSALALLLSLGPKTLQPTSSF